MGGPTKLNHLVRLDEIRFLETGFSKTKFLQNCGELCRVFVRRPNKNIKVSRIARAPVKGEAVRADYDVFNAAGV